MNIADQRSVSGLCDFCFKSICCSNKIWDLHHPEAELLQISASRGCLFCRTLLNDLSALEFNLFPWPLYRWNLRVLAPTRESQQIVILTFRSILAIPGGCDPHPDIDSLPDRVFHFYQEQELGHVPELADIGHSTNSSRTWKQIKQWLETCNSGSHPRCGHRRKKPDSVPARLLEISKICSPPAPDSRIRVVSTASDGIHEPYVTLSHRWADNAEFLQLTKSNNQALTTDGFAWSDPLLPPTFRDAILLARAMDINYMWIDSLCIIQEKSPHWNDQNVAAPETETQKESKLMHLYYTNSFCNISTADSGSGLPGLFRNRRMEETDTSNIIPPSIVLDEFSLVFGSMVWRVISDSLWDGQLLGNKLYTRAWVFQERMLSPRILHFSKNQVFWECSTISACEGLPDGLPSLSNVTAVRDRHWRSRLQAGFSLHQRPLAGEDDESMDTLWKNAVKEYTRCQLSEDGDKLVAIWSVAKLVKDALDEDYQAGLWSGALEEQLAWRVIDCRQADGSPSIRIDPTTTPSWSWASLNGMIEPCDRFRGVDALERVYRVVDHRGLRIRFNKELGRSKSEPIDVVRLSTLVARGPQIRSNAKQDRPVLKGGADLPPTFKDSTIAVKGYLRQGCLSFNDDSRKWELIPFSASVSHAYEGENIQGDKQNANGGINRRAQFMQVFPDVDPGDETARLDCWLVVLAYSEYLGDMRTYSGVGLILRRVDESHFARIGAFKFDELDEETLQAFTAVSLEREFREANVAASNTFSQRNVMTQADNFWLV